MPPRSKKQKDIRKAQGAGLAQKAGSGASSGDTGTTQNAGAAQNAGTIQSAGNRIIQRPSTNNTIVPGRSTRASWDTGTGLSVPLTPERAIPTELLASLRLCRNIQQALKLLKTYHPDVSMAVWNNLRLANIGHKMEIQNLNGKDRLARAEKKWNDELAPRIYSVSNAGLDGLVDMLHLSAIINGAMAVEVEVSEDLTDIVDVHWVDPMTIEWVPENRNGRRVLIPYQQQDMKNVSLENANFFWVPIDPDGDKPIGTPPHSAAVMAADGQMQIQLDMQKVLHNQGWPRYDVSLALELVLAATPPDIKADHEKLRKYLMQKLSDIQGYFDDLRPDDSFIHFDDSTIKMVDGATNGSRGIDVRAINEGIDIGVMAGLKQLSIFMNRNQGVTETWGTVQFKIQCAGIRSLQRGSKRIIEAIAKLALRVWGMQGIPTLTYNEVDDQSEKARLDIDNTRADYWSFCQDMGWVTEDEAAEAVVGHKATGTPKRENSGNGGGGNGGSGGRSGSSGGSGGNGSRTSNRRGGRGENSGGSNGASSNSANSDNGDDNDGEGGGRDGTGNKRN